MQTENLPHIELQNLLAAHHEWLLIYSSGKNFALLARELELDFERGRTLLGFTGERGYQTWRVAQFETKKEEIHLRLTRNFEKERAKIRLVPRALAKTLGDAVELARLDRAQKIAAIFRENYPQFKLKRVALNKENGRFAQILIEDVRGERRTAILADVSESLTPEIFLSTSILWLARLARRRKNPVENLWIAAEKRQAKRVQKLHALLQEDWKSKIGVKEIVRAEADHQGSTIKDLPPLEIVDLWRSKARATKLPAIVERSAAAREIIALAPGEIDVVYSKHGETLRFNGLPFARVRRVLEREQVWFGTGRARQLLTGETRAEFGELVENLRVFRAGASPNRRHSFYRDAPEAWLEAILRRNIKLLDANLILSPLYHQFRAEREKIDLLALRRDGRLVVIELKTAPDREMVFQTADYWRKIEQLRRRGALRESGLFGALEITDAPAVCYLVAPTLSFHRDFEFLARTLAPEIEIHRFNLAENWRTRFKVFERRAAGNH